MNKPNYYWTWKEKYPHEGTIKEGRPSRFNMLMPGLTGEPHTISFEAVD